jgi:hypothetical protein
MLCEEGCVKDYWLVASVEAPVVLEEHLCLRVEVGRECQSRDAHHLGAPEGSGELTHPVRVYLHVVIGVRDDLACSVMQSRIAGDVEAEAGLAHVPHTVESGDYAASGIRAGRVVHDEDFERGRGQPHKSRQAASQCLGTLSRADHYGDLPGGQRLLGPWIEVRVSA